MQESDSQASKATPETPRGESAQAPDAPSSAAGKPDKRAERAAQDADKREAARLKRDTELAKKRGFIRWKAAAGLPLVFGLFALGYWFYGDSLARSAVEASLTASFGAQTRVEMDDCEFSIFGPKVRIAGLRCSHPTRTLKQESLDTELAALGNDEWQPIFSMDTLEADVAFLPLLQGRFWIDKFHLGGVQVHPRNFSKLEKPPEEEPSPAPAKTPVEALNEILDQFEELRRNEWVKRGESFLRDALEGKDKETEAERQARLEAQARAKLLSSSPPYVVEHLASLPYRPAFLLREGQASNMTLIFDADGTDRTGKERAFHRLADASVMARDISSNPRAWERAFIVEGHGNINGKAGRDLSLRFVLNYAKSDDDRLLPSGLSFKSDALTFVKIFSHELRDVEAGLNIYPRKHPEAKGASILSFKGSLAPEAGGDAKTGRVAASLWLPLGKGANDVAGIALAIEDLPVDDVLHKLGALPFEFEPGMRGSLATCTADGRTVLDAPEDPAAAIHAGHGRIEMHLALKLHGVKLRPVNGRTVLGIPSERFVPVFNRFAAQLQADGQPVELQVGFTGEASDVRFDLERPGSRGLIDAVLNALVLETDELNAWGDLPFRLASGGTVSLASVEADGERRGRDSPGADGHDLSGLRVRAELRGVRVADADKPVLGIPGERFRDAFNSLLDPDGNFPFPLQLRVFDDSGAFKPQLESPGTRGLVDAMINAMHFTADDLNGEKELGIVWAKGGKAALTSIDADGKKRDHTSDGARSNSLADLRIRAELKGMRIASAKGDVLGIPGERFKEGFNNLVDAEGNFAFPLQFRVFDDKGAFKPKLESPGARGFVDAMINATKLTAETLNKEKDLNIVWAKGGTVVLASIDGKGKVRDHRSEGAESSSLAGLRARAELRAMRVERTNGDVLGIPGDMFRDAYNASLDANGNFPVPLGVRLVDDKGRFSPALEQGSYRPLIEAIVGVIKLDMKSLTGGVKAGGIVFDDKLGIALEAPDKREPTLQPEGARLDAFSVGAKLTNAALDPKKQPKQLAGMPSEYFVFAWNKYLEKTGGAVPAKVRLYDESGAFTPQVSLDPAAMAPDIGKAIGVPDFSKEPEKLAKVYGKEFDGYLKGMGKSLEDLVKDPTKLLKPGEAKPPDLPQPPKLPDPKLPELPKLPDPKLPKLPGR